MILFSSRVTLVLCVVNFFVLFGGGLYVTLYEVDHLPKVLPLSPQEASFDNIARQLRSPISFDVLESRPLFHQSRKEYIVKKIEPVRNQSPRVVNPLTTYQLKGIVFIKSGNSLAILIHISSGKTLKLKVGDNFEGWKVKAILKGAVELTKGAETAQLKLINSTKNK